MFKLIANRLAQTLVTLLIVTLMTFTLLAAAGGDALNTVSEDPLASEATIAQMRRIYGLDQPMIVRYWRWLAGMAGGDMGDSFYYHAPVARLILPRLLNTALLALLALSLAWGAALILGVLAARRRGSWIDRLSEGVILLAASTPRIVLALVVLAAASRLSMATSGSGFAGTASGVANGKGIFTWQILLPSVVLAVPLVALFLAQVRAGVRQALSEDFVLVARAKGLRERDILLRHALRAALNPLITIFGYSLGGILSGSVIVETILGWPGLGSLSVVAVRSRDVPLLLGIVVITAMAVFMGNLLADILLHLNDPRLRQKTGKRGGGQG